MRRSNRASQAASWLLTHGLLGCLGQHPLAGGQLRPGSRHKPKHGQASVDGLGGLRGEEGGGQAHMRGTAGAERAWAASWGAAAVSYRRRGGGLTGPLKAITLARGV